MSDGHVVFYLVIDYKVVAFDWCAHRPFFCPMGTEYYGVTTLRKVSLLVSHPCFMPTKYLTLNFDTGVLLVIPGAYRLIGETRVVA